MTPRLVLALLAAAAVALVACTETVDEPDDPYAVTAVPWLEQESRRYVLLNDDGDVEGRGSLAIAVDGERVSFIQSFTDERGNADTSVLVADTAGLRPIFGRREVIDVEEDKRIVLLAEYGALDDGEYGVRIEELEYRPRTESEHDRRRCSPMKLPESAFDNDSSLFVWRTLAFEKGVTADYTASITNGRDHQIISLRVLDMEDVETPAGTFDAWHVRIEGEGRSHDAWFATTPDHRMLKYDNDDLVFLYEGDDRIVQYPGEPPDGVSPACLPQEGD